MATGWEDFVKQVVSGTPGTGTVTLGAAVSGYSALSSAMNGLTIPGFFEDGTARETGEYLYTHSGPTLARTKFRKSTTGSALSLTSSAIFQCDATAIFAQGMDIAAQSIIPGGRLTLTTAVPITTADVTAATTIYYTPYVHNGIALWDGNRWQPVIFSEVSLALGTLTSGKPYDVFGYLSSEALATELLAWTNDSTRATAVTLQDGRYCKSGDKTRLLLGTFYTTSTTATEDSVLKRFVSNVYNNVRRVLRKADSTTSWTYASTTHRQARASTANQVELVVSVTGPTIDLALSAIYGAGTNSGQAGIGEDSTTTSSAEALILFPVTADVAAYGQAGRLVKKPTPGYHKYVWLEACNGGVTVTFYGADNSSANMSSSGLMGSIDG